MRRDRAAVLALCLSAGILGCVRAYFAARLEDEGVRREGLGHWRGASGQLPGAPASGIVPIDAAEINATIALLSNGKQMTAREYHAVVDAITVAAGRAAREGATARVLVYGLGKDSLLYARANADGASIFVEDVPEFLAAGAGWGLDVHAATYTTTVRGSVAALRAPGGPPEARRTGVMRSAEARGGGWDVVLIDAPRGYADHLPGRAVPIAEVAEYAAVAHQLRPLTVFLHNCDRPLEAAHADAYLGPPARAYDQMREWHWPMLGAAVATIVSAPHAPAG